MTARLGRILIYTHKTDDMIAFYSTHFGYTAIRRDGDRIVELRPGGDGAAIMLHAAAKGQKSAQSVVKLVFDVLDVAEFCRASRARGLTFGPIHDADGYQFANAKDPAMNAIQVSSRAWAVPHSGDSDTAR